MTWVRVDDGFADHPKILDVSDGAFRLHVCAMCWAGRRLTNGAVRQRDLRILVGMLRTPPADPAELVQELLDAGLWELTPEGWQIHDWLEYNPSADKVTAGRTANAERQRRFKEKNKDGTEPLVTPLSGSFSTPLTTTPRPDPTRPIPPEVDSKHLGKQPPPVRKATAVPTKVEPDSIGAAWKALVEKVQALAPPKAYATTTGLNPNEEGPLSRGYNDSRSAGYKAADIVGLADWILDGGLKTRTSPREYICRNLCTCLDDAQKWRDADKPPLGKERAPPKVDPVKNPVHQPAPVSDAVLRVRAARAEMEKTNADAAE